MLGALTHPSKKTLVFANRFGSQLPSPVLWLLSQLPAAQPMSHAPCYTLQQPALIYTIGRQLKNVIYISIYSPVFSLK